MKPEELLEDYEKGYLDLGTLADMLGIDIKEAERRVKEDED